MRLSASRLVGPCQQLPPVGMPDSNSYAATPCDHRCCTLLVLSLSLGTKISNYLVDLLSYGDSNPRTSCMPSKRLWPLTSNEARHGLRAVMTSP
jgi:hypothetical protein